MSRLPFAAALAALFGNGSIGYDLADLFKGEPGSPRRTPNGGTRSGAAAAKRAARKRRNIRKHNTK